MYIHKQETINVYNLLFSRAASLLSSTNFWYCCRILPPDCSCHLVQTCLSSSKSRDLLIISVISNNSTQNLNLLKITTQFFFLNSYLVLDLIHSLLAL